VTSARLSLCCAPLERSRSNSSGDFLLSVLRHGDALNGDGHRVLHGAGLDVGGGAHARPQLHRLVVTRIFTRKFVTSSWVRRWLVVAVLAISRTTRPLCVGVGVDADAGRVADLHVDDVVLIDVDLRFHVGQVGDAHDFGAGELARADDTLAEPRGQGADACRRTANGLMVFPSASLICLSAPSDRWMSKSDVSSAALAMSYDVCAALRSLSEIKVLIVEALDALVVLLRLGQLGAVLNAGRLRAAEGRFLRLDLRAVAVRTDAQQQIAAVQRSVPLFTVSSMISPETSGAILVSTSG